MTQAYTPQITPEAIFKLKQILPKLDPKKKKKALDLIKKYEAGLTK
jgi:hypothetical protein